ncbi:GmrSD restriction endonuclease domain-containing protein [Candidatus Poriferisodalis sp.]|uniref:GmrSD restriction endonuclease domain-containing protein n=1 Tax=Candidatus Poriferisodalis sp. TaxID=3101277 RepID=UPI003B5A0181
MKATETRLLDFLENSPQFVIPVYQRTYSWTERECKQLWDDVLRTGGNEQVTTHFVGSIVYIGEGAHHVTRRPPLLVIDGQQRLTTAMLMLEALARHVGDDEPVDGFSALKIRNYYLLNDLEKDERRFKLLLTQTDKESLISLMGQKPPPVDQSWRIHENFEFFEKQISALGDDLEPLCSGLAKLMIVDIALSRDQDNPQLIFESMNSTGRELSQADLIRNFVLMGLPPAEQKQLYERHWRPMEVAFGQKSYGTHFDSFMRHYLTLKTGEIPKISAVYEAFKAYARRPQIAPQGIGQLVADVHRFASHYCSMALDQEPGGVLGAAFRDLRELRVDVAYPLLLELYDDYRAGQLSGDEFCQAVRLIESYVFRRAVCSIPTNSLNNTFATFSRDLQKDRYLESIKARFLLLPSYRRFPRDEEFKRELQSRDVYNFPRRSYWLRRFENHGRKERVPVDEYTIEHIMPQNPAVSAQWQKDLGEEWQRVHETFLHTLGNLTLTGYNSEYSDRSFAEKRDMEGGFKDSPLKLNKGLGTLERWDELAIQARARHLAEIAAMVWADVHLPEDQLAQYRTQPERGLPNTYTIDDHPQLASGGTSRSLFDAFRAEVLALSPVVAEEYLKLYVAYKAETNFVDVVPQASRLRLALNMQFHELHDPRHLAKDVTNLGRWGNGDVEVHFGDLTQLPHVMALVRQAFEKQMGNGDGDA